MDWDFGFAIVNVCGRGLFSLPPLKLSVAVCVFPVLRVVICESSAISASHLAFFPLRSPPAYGSVCNDFRFVFSGGTFRLYASAVSVLVLLLGGRCSAGGRQGCLSVESSNTSRSSDSTITNFSTSNLCKAQGFSEWMERECERREISATVFWSCEDDVVADSVGELYTGCSCTSSVVWRNSNLLSLLLSQASVG